MWNVQGGGDYYGGFGIGQLWFILFLLFISLFALPLLLWWRSTRGEQAARRFSRFLARPWAWPIIGFALMIAEGLPSPIDDKSFFYFLALFILGYAIMADEAFLTSAERHRWPSLIIGAAIIVFRMAARGLHDGLPDPSWGLAVFSTATLTAVWLVLTGLLGAGRRYLDRRSGALDYLAEASYPLYILHQTVIVVAAFYLVDLPGPWAVQWVALLAVTLAVTFGLYAIVRQVGVLRFLFGMRAKSRAPSEAARGTGDRPG